MAFKKKSTSEKFWDLEVTICEVPKNEKNKIVIKNVSKDDKDYVDVRNYYLDKEGNWMPAKGIAIPMENASDVANIILGAVKEGLPF
jgi:hypothetical protein